MSKNKEINFVGQPIFKQIIDLLKVVDIPSLIKLLNSDNYYKAPAKSTAGDGLRNRDNRFFGSLCF